MSGLRGAGATLAAAALAASVFVAVIRTRAARDTALELAAAKQQSAKLQAIAAAAGENARAAERKAREAEHDTGELLKTVESVRTSVAAATAPSSASGAAANTEQSAAERQRLLQERSYQQQLARKRAEEAKERAKLLTAAHEAASPEEQFKLLFAAAQQQAARAEFDFARRTFNEAMQAKPAELVLPPEAVALRQTLAAQNEPVQVTLSSDGATFVSILGRLPPSQLPTVTLALRPGDYEVLGRREGFRDVQQLLQVRSGLPPLLISIVCAEPVNR